MSSDHRVGIDIEIPSIKTEKIKHKFLNENEQLTFSLTSADPKLTTVLWSAKESVFKWYGHGSVDFRKHIQLTGLDKTDESIICHFSKTNQELLIRYHDLDHLILAWIVS